jgi:low affinity Fe/Cu permease
MVKTVHDKTTTDEPKKKRSKISQLFSEVANTTSRAAGRAFTFIVAAGIVLIWALTGPLFHYSDTWQLVINTGTTIVTFLMVFLIQNSQNRDGAAIQVKLDELIRVSKVQNTFIGIEHLTDEELDEIKEKCEQRAAAVEDGEDRENAIDRTSRNAKRATDLAT